MEKHNFRRFINLETLITLMWGIFIISLPFNSFPHLPAALGGKAVVRPMVIFPLVGILITVVFPKIFTERLPATIIPLMIFVLVAVGGSVFALFRGIDPFREVTALDRLIRSVFTLVLGAAVYLGVVFVLVRQRNLKFTLKLVYLSAAIAFGIGSLQAIYVVTRSETWFSMMSVFQRIFSIRKLFIDRVSGPTYEPNWFSDQIMLVFVPFLLAALITGYSISTKRFLRLSLEGWLLLWALINLVMTFSRGGLAVLVPTVILGLVFYWWMGQNQAGYSKRQKIESLIKIAGIGILILVVLASAVYYFGQDNKFIRQIWDWKQGKVEVDSLADYFFILGIDSRLIYSRTAYHIFEEYPLTGVGLGNYAFYFVEHMPEKHLGLYPEVLRYIVPEAGRNQLITPKNLYMRILAETGIIGFASFASFVIAVFGCALFLFTSKNVFENYFGVVGLVMIFVFLLSANSYDSFSFPNMWFMFGIITGAAHLFRNDQNQENSAMV